MNDEYTKEEMEKTGNYVYGGKRHDAVCDELEKSGYTELEINLVSIGVWKGIESERNKSQEEIKRLKKENKKLRKCVEFYADESNWRNMNHCENDKKSKIRIDAIDFTESANFRWDDMSFIGGKIARQTLMGIENDKF